MSGVRAVSLVLGCLGVLLFAAPRAGAQVGGVVQGRVVAAESGEPLGLANITLRAADGETVIASSAADGAGRFRVAGLRPGLYVLEIAYIGHAPLTREVTVAAGAVTDLGTLQLMVEAIALDEMTVETQRPPVTFAPDRDIYATASLPGADGGVATELLSSIPELEVDFEGNIILRGSAPQIYINGRPAPMEGEALAAFLEQFPADRIERIEVIPNPSARFDAQGSGGIVNIVLKQGVELGAQGSVSAHADSRGSVGGGGRLSWQRGPLIVHAEGFARRSDQDRTGFDLRENLLDDPPTLLRKDTWSKDGRLFGNGRLSADLRLGERASLRAEGRFTGFGANSEGADTTTHMDFAGTVTQRYSRLSRSESSRRAADASLEFRYAFAPERHTLEIELELEDEHDTGDQRVETVFEVLESDDAPVPAALALEDTEERNRELTLKVDYVRPLGQDGQIEVGYRGSRETRDNERLLEEFDDVAGSAPLESSLRGFTHEEAFHTGYLTVAQRLGAFGLQLGGRLQRADTRFELPTGEAFETAGVDFFPSANLTYEMGEGRRLRLSYSRRTRRPHASLLNPTDRSTDPLNRRVGNPDLEPQYTHSLGLDASTSMPWGTLRFSPYYRRVTNDWEQIQRVDENGVSTTTWENVASQEIYGASLTASVRRSVGWGGFISLDGRSQDRDASNLSTDISGRSFYWSVRGNVFGQLPGGLGVRTTLAYTPARDVPQGRVSSRVDSSIGLRQRLLDGRLTLALTARDPFDISRTEFTSNDPTFIQRGQNRVSRRAMSFSMSYSFGGGEGRRDDGERPGRRGRG